MKRTTAAVIGMTFLGLAGCEKVKLMQVGVGVASGNILTIENREPFPLHNCDIYLKDLDDTRYRKQGLSFAAHERQTMYTGDFRAASGENFKTMESFIASVSIDCDSPKGRLGAAAQILDREAFRRVMGR